MSIESQIEQWERTWIDGPEDSDDEEAQEYYDSLGKMSNERLREEYRLRLAQSRDPDFVYDVSISMLDLIKDELRHRNMVIL
jgi:hypothetical protein